MITTHARYPKIIYVKWFIIIGGSSEIIGLYERPLFSHTTSVASPFRTSDKLLRFIFKYKELMQ